MIFCREYAGLRLLVEKKVWKNHPKEVRFQKLITYRRIPVEKRGKAYKAIGYHLAVMLCLHFFLLPGETLGKCEKPVGFLVSLQGEAQMKRAGQPTWQPIVGTAEFCAGDSLSVGKKGRAAVMLTNETVLRLDQLSTITFAQPSPQGFSLLEFFRGAMHIFCHRPRSLKVVTPYVNGVVEGTEFLVKVDGESANITVFEGRVDAVNDQGRLIVSGGQSVSAEAGVAPHYRAVVKSRDAVAWTLYYPALIEFDGTGDEKELIRQAAADLGVGRVDEAGQALEKVLQKDPGDGEALALLSIIETVRNNTDRALEFAHRAIAAAPDSAPANLALSYAQQARFDVSAALATLRRAAFTNPQNGLVKARLAELLLAVGELDRAMAVAQEAAELSPLAGLAHTVLGFAYLSQVKTAEAKKAFLEALALDPVFPLARLGLGLAEIREGHLARGRADIEIAAAIDPANSLIRSYLGKAYFAEKRNSLSKRQYKIAKELDPADPTPWFYDAIRNQTVNRPVEALRDLQQSIALNDNRAVYRSRLLLDDDLASRSAALARIYTDLGFEQLARSQGIRSVQTDPANYSAHRFLADAYKALPRHEIARVSELLQSQLLQPLNVTPVQPLLAESNLAIVDGAGPASPSFNEFNPLFLRDTVHLQTSGVAGSNGILGEEVAVSGVEGRLSYSIGRFHYQTDGSRDNSDREHDIHEGYLQAMLSPATSIMTEFRYKENDFGDTTFRIDPEDFSSSLRQFDEYKSARIGMRHDPRPSDTLLGTFVVGADDAKRTTGNDGFFPADAEFGLEADHQTIEIQHIHRDGGFNLRSGAGYVYAEATQTYAETSPMNLYFEDDFTIEHFNIYSYSQINLPEDVVVSLGLGVNAVDSLNKDDNEFNPKLGVVWQPSAATQIRAAAFKTTTRFLFYAQTVEPTFVAGFNQFYDDMQGSTAWTYGAAIDQTFSKNWYGGAQFVRRRLDVPYLDYSPTFEELLEEDDWREDMGSAYLYWTPSVRMSLGLEYYYEGFEHEYFEGVQEIRKLTTHRIVPTAKLFYPSGISAALRAGYVDQEGEFGSRFIGYKEKDDRFWIVDLSLSYRLPKRYGILRLEVKNLLNEEFVFLDTDPANPRLPREQQIIGSFTFSF
jgi:tetratricopeptide (TPR) repeat protein